jgi:hypothetical protein
MGGVVLILVGSTIIGWCIYQLYLVYEPNTKNGRETIVEIQQLYSPKMTSFQAEHVARHSVARTNLLRSLREEASQVAQFTEFQFTDFIREMERDNELLLKEVALKVQKIEAMCRLEHALELAKVSQGINIAQVNTQLLEAQIKEKEAQSKLGLLQDALAEKLVLSDYLDIRKKMAYHKMELEITKDFDRAEFDKAFMQATADIDFAVSSKYFDSHNCITQMQKKLDGLYEEVYYIQTTEKREPIKRAKVKQREKTIHALENDKRILEQGLHQGNYGKNARGTYQKANTRRDPRRPLEES